MAWDSVVVDGTTVDYAVNHNAEIVQIKSKLTGDVGSTPSTFVIVKTDLSGATGSKFIIDATATDIKMDGVQSAGTLDTIPRGDHVHPTDTSRSPLNSPTFTGTISGNGAGITGVGTLLASNLTIAVRATDDYIRKGQACYISGTSAGIPIARLCDCTTVGKMRVIGIAQADMNPGGASLDGFLRRGGELTGVDCRTSGTVARYVNPLGQTWANGDLLFSLGTPYEGGLTNVRPTSGRSVKVCYAVNGNDPSGTLLMHPLENPIYATCAATENVVLRVGDNVGTNKVSIRNYANTEVASFDSYGKLTVPKMTLTSAGATSVADGGTISHLCGATPSVVVLTPSIASEIASVTTIGLTTFTVAIKKRTDGSAGTTQTMYWIALI